MGLPVGRAAKASALALTVVTICSVGCVEVAYRVSLRGIPTLPEPPPSRLPSALEHRVWAYLDGGGVPQVRAIYPWHLLLWVARAIVGQPSQHPGFNISGSVASVHLQSLGQRNRAFTSHVRGMALIVWVSRHFSASDAASYWAVRARGARGAIGLDEGSRAIFDRPASDLNVPQLALLLAVSWNPEANDPWCHPVRAIEVRGKALQQLVRAGIITSEEGGRAAKEPLGVVGRECQ